MLELSLGVELDTKTMDHFVNLYESTLPNSERKKIEIYKKTRNDILKQKKSFWGRKSSK